MKTLFLLLILALSLGVYASTETEFGHCLQQFPSLRHSYSDRLSGQVIDANYTIQSSLYDHAGFAQCLETSHHQAFDLMSNVYTADQGKVLQITVHELKGALERYDKERSRYAWLAWAEDQAAYLSVPRAK